jgi:hypothetical protein
LANQNNQLKGENGNKLKHCTFAKNEESVYMEVAQQFHSSQKPSEAVFTVNKKYLALYQCRVMLR